MKFSNSIVMAAATLAQIATASPLVAREDSSNNTLVARDGNWATCTINNCGLGDQNSNAEVWISMGGPWANDWGHGFLDNLRGECGGDSAIYDWGYDYTDNNGNARAHFYANHGNVCNLDHGACPNGAPYCSSTCIERALWDASNPSGAIWGVTCNTP